jgi:hypothetical protein
MDQGLELARVEWSLNSQKHAAVGRQDYSMRMVGTTEFWVSAHIRSGAVFDILWGPEGFQVNQEHRGILLRLYEVCVVQWKQEQL